MNINTVSMWDKKYGDPKAPLVWSSDSRLHPYDLVAEVLSDEPARILDVGSGLGIGAAHLMSLNKDWEVEGLDFSPKACRDSSVVSHCLDIRIDPLPGQYDYIISVQTMEHMVEPLVIIRKLCEAATKAVILTVPYGGGLSDQHQTVFNEYDFSGFDPVEIFTQVWGHRSYMRVVIRK